MRARFRPRSVLTVIAVVCATCLPVLRAQDASPIPVEQWLRGPDRRDFAWNVRLVPPRLTFQQRYLLQVRADVDVDALPAPEAGRELHFLVKVADAQGRWLAGNDHNRFAVPPNLDHRTAIQFTTGLYLRHGKYTVAVFAYDTVRQRGNLWRKALEIPPPRHDPLPQLDRHLEPVEFLTDVPRDSIPERVWAVKDDAWPLGTGREWLPVHNPRPVRVDVVMNLSNWLHPRFLGAPSAAEYRQRVGRMLQMGSVLSHLHLERGCVRVSGVDIHRLRVVFDRADAAGFDWGQAQAKVFSADQNLVDVSTLEQRKDTALFFRRFLSDILYNSPGCGDNQPVHRVVIIAGPSHLFPEGTRAFGVWPEMPCDCEFVYLQADASPYDDMEGMLKRVKRRQFRVSTAEQFRTALAQLIRHLENPASGFGR